MAASDPVPSVPTPTGALQGVAAYAWTGSAWTPTAGSGADVATPTGVLRGVAPFTWDGAAWQPAGKAQPGVPAATGALDGVAVYTWSGSAWTPASGNPSTPSGPLRGVAAFNWDGTNWQPVGRAGPTVATPYGALDGVAMFNWTGSAWGAVAGPALNMSFMQPGALDARVAFTRASTATYFDVTGTMQTAAVNAPRWDYDPATHVLRGLLLEEARTNAQLSSGNLGQSPWATGASGTAPVVTANAITAPDGTLSGTRIVMPAVPAGANNAFVYAQTGIGASQSAYSIWLRGAAGGEVVNLFISNFANYFHTTATLTTAWQRFSVVGTPTGTGYGFCIGTDMRDATQTPTVAETFYAWGAQSEIGGFATSYIPTTGAAVTRAYDSCVIPPANMAPWFASPGGSWMAEFINADPLVGDRSARIIGLNAASGITPLWEGNTAILSNYDGPDQVTTANTVTANVVSKGASTYAPGTGTICLNGGAVATAAMTVGFAALATSGVGLLAGGPGVVNELMVGYLRNVRYWSRVLSNAELQSVTT